MRIKHFLPSICIILILSFVPGCRCNQISRFNSSDHFSNKNPDKVTALMIKYKSKLTIKAHRATSENMAAMMNLMEDWNPLYYTIDDLIKIMGRQPDSWYNGEARYFFDNGVVAPGWAFLTDANKHTICGVRVILGY